MRREARVASLALALVLLCTGCFTILTPTASFEITDWEQEYYEYLEFWSLVSVYFRVTNTGPVDIDYYEVWIEVTCRDGSTYQEWTNGLNVPRGSYVSDYTLIDTADKEAVSVRITRYELTSY